MKMAPPDMDALDDTRRQMRDAGTPHAVATVVRTIDATSAKAGAKAIVSAEGAILEGWVGGGCARGAIGRAAKKAIERNEPVLVALRPDHRLAAEGIEPCEIRDGMVYERNGCASKGSLDIYVEPFVPAPELVILGDGPVAHALSALARSFDFRVAGDLPDGPDLHDLYVVVATQGRGDAAALGRALACGARFTAFVGSARKSATLKDTLAAKGADPETLARLVAPAGLYIGATTPAEIALSILAQIVQVRRGGTLA